MSDKYTEVRTSIRVPRKCEFCGCTWSFVKEVGGAGEGWSNEAAVEAHEKLADHVQEALDPASDDGSHSLCPSCHRFSSRVMQRYFPQGFRARLLAAIKMNELWHVFWSGGIALIAVQLVIALLLMKAAYSPAPIGFYMLKVVGTLALCGAIFYLLQRFAIPAIRSLRRLPVYRTQIAALTDGQVFSIIEDEYNELDQTGIPGGFCWGWHKTHRDLLEAGDTASTNRPSLGGDDAVHSSDAQAVPMEPMGLLIRCTACGKRVKILAAAATARKTLRCPSCKEPLDVPP